AFAVYINKYINPTIDIDLDSFRLNFTSFVYYTDKKTGKPAELEQLYGTENRVWANYDEIPDNLKNAFVAIEDARFFRHHGVDWKRTIGATLGWSGLVPNFVGGGSTITQQLIKNITKDDDVTVQRKIQEILRALNLEKKYRKEDILELYLNTIFLSRNCNGVKTAAKLYFGKELKDLTLAECASIAGITKNPSYYDPFRFPEHNKERQELILKEMLSQGMIKKEEYDAAIAQKLNFKDQENEAAQASKQSYFVDQVITDVLNDLENKKHYSKELATKLLYSGGLQIYSTIDVDIQSKMDQVFLNEKNFPGVKGKDGSMPQAAMVIVDPYTGNVLAMYGGRGAKTVNRGLNRATQAYRSPGSSIKPLSVYAPAIEYGLITPATVMDDVPKDFTVNAKGWPKNDDNIYNGRLTVQKAVEVSNNTIPVEIMQKLTPQKSFDFMQNNMNIKLVETRKASNGKTQTDIALAPLALGGLTKGVTVLEMAAGYSTFVNKGIYNKTRTYTKVVDSNGTVILENKPETNIAMKEKTSYYMLDLLKGVVTGPSGTGRRAALGNIAVAGKTGTTTGSNDRWFVGLTPYYVGTVWFGYDNPQEVRGVTSNPSLLIWKAVMQKVLEGYSPRQFEDHSGFVSTQICLDSGLRPTDACYRDPRGSRVATVRLAREDIPAEECNVHFPVQIDKSTNMIASEFCPKEYLGAVSLLKIDRIFPKPGVVVSDQKYVLPQSLNPAEQGKSGYSAVAPGGAAGYRLCNVHNYLPPAVTDPPSDGQDGEEVTPPDTDNQGGNNGGNHGDSGDNGSEGLPGGQIPVAID
ncbi:MAG: PBP1A family penicillin-binding protein, partial [Bacillota bacterium]|nr:PBP1A family penicillin-binding protein [Bacillota bacterium]